MTVVDLPEPCRVATGRFRQKGEADLLHMSELNAEIAFVDMSAHTRSGLHQSSKLAEVNTMVVVTLRPHSYCVLHIWLLREFVVRTDLNHFLDQCSQ